MSNTETLNSLETCLSNHKQLKMDVENSSDGELASAIRAVAALLNTLADKAAKRELIVTYRIKDGLKTDGLTNPRIIVSVTTEVI